MIYQRIEKQYLGSFVLIWGLGFWRNSLILFMLIAFTNGALAQNEPVSKHKMGPRVRSLARESLNCLLQQDFDGYMKFVYPTMLAKTAEVLNPVKNMQAMAKEEGFPLERRKVSVGKPGRILQYQNELQCVLPVKVTICRKTGPMRVKMGMIAVSMDGGNRWYFMSSNRTDIDALRREYPNLSPDLRLIKSSKSKGFSF
jgi:hypothetical protein